MRKGKKAQTLGLNYTTRTTLYLITKQLLNLKYSFSKEDGTQSHTYAGHLLYHGDIPSMSQVNLNFFPVTEKLHLLDIL